MWYWIDTGWACGGIKIENRIIVDSAPVFYKLRGKKLIDLPSSYQLKKLGDKCDSD